MKAVEDKNGLDVIVGNFHIFETIVHVMPQISKVIFLFFIFFIQDFNVQLFYIPKIYKTILF